MANVLIDVLLIKNGLQRKINVLLDVQKIKFGKIINVMTNANQKKFMITKKKNVKKDVQTKLSTGMTKLKNVNQIVQKTKS